MKKLLAGISAAALCISAVSLRVLAEDEVPEPEVTEETAAEETLPEEAEEETAQEETLPEEAEDETVVPEEAEEEEEAEAQEEPVSQTTAVIEQNYAAEGEEFPGKAGKYTISMKYLVLQNDEMIHYMVFDRLEQELASGYLTYENTDYYINLSAKPGMIEFRWTHERIGADGMPEIVDYVKSYPFQEGSFELDEDNGGGEFTFVRIRTVLEEEHAYSISGLGAQTGTDDVDCGTLSASVGGTRTAAAKEGIVSRCPFHPKTAQ